MEPARHRRRILIISSLVVIIAAIGFFVFVGKGKLTSPTQLFTKQATKVQVKTTYNNPFNKESQYVNPFETYKNPFVTNR